MSRLISDLRHDVAHAWRALSRAPSFTIVVVAILALGIGANTAIFSVVNGVLMRALPYDHPERIAYLWQSFDGPEPLRVNVSIPEFRDYEQHAQALEAIGGIVPSSVALGDGDGAEPERVPIALVTPGFFDVFRVRPALGRVFSAEEAQVPFAVFGLLSDRLWRRRFGANPSIIGQPVRMGGRLVTIVGVMPPGFAFPADVDIWRPLVIAGANATDRSRRFVDAVVRIREGLTMQAASASVHATEQAVPEHDVSRTQLVALRDELVGPIRPALLILLGAVGLVLLIACANVANLQLARAAARHREMAVRTALGATRDRLVRQMLTESIVLSLGGAVVGLGLAAIGIRALRALGGNTVPRVHDITLDWRVLAFTLMVSVATGLLFGLAPALGSGTRIDDVSRTLRSTRGSTGSRARRLRSVLVVAELALSLTLVVGATLLAKSFVRLRRVELGFRAEQLLTLRIALPFALYPESAQRVAFFDAALQRMRDVPGVVGAGAVSIPPVTRDNASSSAIAEGREQEGHFPEANVRTITPGYLEALGVPLLRGRWLDATDGGGERPRKVALVNASLAKTLWPGQDAIGKRFSVNAPPDRPDWREVVGVVGDMRQSTLDAPPRIEMYEPHQQVADGSMSLMVRTRGDPVGVVPAVREIVRSLDRSLPIDELRTMEQRLGASLAARRFQQTLLGGFAVLALLLAAVGLYGVIGYSVTQRTVEIGVRIALGAGRGAVLRLVLRQGMTLAALGVAIGAVGALALTRVVAPLLYDVRATDPLTYLTTAALLVAVAMGASVIPARRAARIEPVVALRFDS